MTHRRLKDDLTRIDAYTRDTMATWPDECDGMDPEPSTELALWIGATTIALMIVFIGWSLFTMMAGA